MSCQRKVTKRKAPEMPRPTVRSTTEWTAQKCPRQCPNQSGSSNGSDSSHLPTKRYTARSLRPRCAWPTGPRLLNRVIGGGDSREVRVARFMKYLAAERSEDGADERHTALSGGAACQNHCSNHSGVVTGSDTFVRSTLTTMAGEVLRYLAPFFGGIRNFVCEAG